MDQRAMVVESQSTRQCVKAVFGSVAAVLPPLAVSLFACAVLALPDQILDIYRAIAQTVVKGPLDPGKASILEYFAIWREPVTTWSAALALSFSIWLVA